VLFVGRLVEKKRVRFLIEAWPAVLSEYPGAQLVIAGDGPDRQSLLKACGRMGIEDTVQFLGAIPQSELPSLYRSSAVFVLPSVVAAGGDQEGFGLVLVEALGCACAVVTTDLPAMRDIVIEGKTGAVVPGGSSTELARAIVDLLNDPERRHRLGTRGRTHVLGRFSWSRVSARYRDLIDDLINQDTTG